MESNEIKIIYSKIFKNTSLWASQSYTRSLLIGIIFLILGIPLVEYLQNIVKNINYFSFFITISSLIERNFDPTHYLIFFVLLIISIFLFLINRRLLNSEIIKDNFDGGLLNKWAIPLDASWTTEKCEDVLGKMLSVTYANYPGTLKGAYGWYDYEISFWTKINKDVPDHEQNFTVVIRSESNFNGVMLQITKTNLRPHFIYNGTFIVDNNARQQLPTTLRVDEWIKVKLVVYGTDVEININDYKLKYQIPTKVFDVDDKIMAKGTVALEEIENSHNDIKSKYSKILEISRMPESSAREEAIKTIDPIMKSIPSYSKIILEYQKGSIGFREAGKERAHFRNFQVKRI